MGRGGVVCTVIFVSNQPVVLGCVGVGVLTILFSFVPHERDEFTLFLLIDLLSSDILPSL